MKYKGQTIFEELAVAVRGANEEAQRPLGELIGPVVIIEREADDDWYRGGARHRLSV